MSDLCYHNLNIYAIFLIGLFLTASILCNLYCPFLLFVVILCFYVNWNVCFLTTSPNK